MSLNNNQMLPERIRNMRQMQDVLNVEDIILEEIERIINEMYQRASLLHEELINETWLEKQLQKITGGSVDVTKKKDMLFLEIQINRGNLSDVDKQTEDITTFLNKWLPAHLAYGVAYVKLLSAVDYYAAIWQHDEILTLRQVII